MVWIIVVAVLVVLVVALWSRKRLEVLKRKAQLEQTIESVITSFIDLKARVNELDLRDHEKRILVGNIERNLETLERWKTTAIPNITFFKNHTIPIEREFNELRESVAKDLSKYEGLPKLPL